MLTLVVCFADQSQAPTGPSAVPQDKVVEAMSRIVMTSRGVTYGIAFGLLGLLVGLLSQRRAVLSLWWIGLWCFHIGVSTALVSGCVFIDLTQNAATSSKASTNQPVESRFKSRYDSSDESIEDLQAGEVAKPVPFNV